MLKFRKLLNSQRRNSLFFHFVFPKVEFLNTRCQLLENCRVAGRRPKRMWILERQEGQEGSWERLSCANCTTNQSSVLSITVASVARATRDARRPAAAGAAKLAATRDLQHLILLCSGTRTTWRLLGLALLLISCLVWFSLFCSIFLTISFVAVAFCVLSIVAQFFNLLHDVDARQQKPARILLGECAFLIYCCNLLSLEKLENYLLCRISGYQARITKLKQFSILLPIILKLHCNCAHFQCRFMYSISHK